MKTLSPQCRGKELRDHWNQVANGLDDFFGAPSTQYYQRSEIFLIKRFFGNLKGKKLLKLDLWNEVLNTRILLWIASQGAQVYGLDISDYLVKKAKENFKKAKLSAKLINCDMRQIKFPENTFDYLYTMGTIEHIHDSEKAIAEIYRVLKPGGRCIIGVPNRFDPFLRPVLVKFLEIFGRYPYSPEKAFSRKEFKRLIRNYRFKIIADSGILFMPGTFRMADLVFYKYCRPLCFLTKILMKPFEALERRYELLQKDGYLIVCVAEKPRKEK